MANNYTDNTVHNRGFGEWMIALYKPEEPVGPLEGELFVGKDFHTILNLEDDGKKKCIASFPSQNVAYVVDQHYLPIAQE